MVIRVSFSEVLIFRGRYWSNLWNSISHYKTLDLHISIESMYKLRCVVWNWWIWSSIGSKLSLGKDGKGECGCRIEGNIIYFLLTIRRQVILHSKWRRMNTTPNIGIGSVILLIHRFGTHPSGPSEILVDGEFQLLKTFLEVHFNVLFHE